MTEGRGDVKGCLVVRKQVVHEVLIAEILLLLLNKPSDDSVEIAVGIMKEVGAFLEEMNLAIANAIFDQLRNILHEADIDKRTQYMIEVLFEVRRTKYKEHPTIKEDLDLVEEEDQITHRHTLEDDVKVEDGLNIRLEHHIECRPATRCRVVVLELNESFACCVDPFVATLHFRTAANFLNKA